MDRPLFLQLPHAVVFWIVWLWVCYPEWRLVRRSRAALQSATSRDSGSLRLLELGLPAAVVAAFLVASLRPEPTADSLAVFSSGIFLMIAGSILRRYCWRVLGHSFTGHVAVVPGQPVITSGPYRYLRHPAYSGAILSLLGFGIALGSLAGSAILLATSAIVYGYRIKVEERAMREELGAAYAAYAATRKRLIPFVL